MFICERRNKQAFDFLLMTNPQLINQVSTRPTVRCFFARVAPLYAEPSTCGCVQLEGFLFQDGTMQLQTTPTAAEGSCIAIHHQDGGFCHFNRLYKRGLQNCSSEGLSKLVVGKGANPNVVRKLKDLTRSRVGLPAKNKDNAQLYKSVQLNGYEQEMRFQTNCDSSTHMSYGPKGPEDAKLHWQAFSDPPFPGLPSAILSMADIKSRNLPPHQ